MHNDCLLSEGPINSLTADTGTWDKGLFRILMTHSKAQCCGTTTISCHLVNTE